TGATLHHFATTGSTNDDAFALQSRGANLPAWVMADAQTHGRGRGDHHWQSLAGNLQASYVFQTVCDMQHISQLAFVAGLAVRETVNTLLKNEPDPANLISLKWPNDVLCAGEKIAGVLVQTARTDAKAPLTAVIGIGLNIAQHPSELDQPATSLRSLLRNGSPLPTLQDVITVLDQNMSSWLIRWRSGAGWSDVRTHWIMHNGLFGQRVTVRAGQTSYTGTMKGLDPTGALIVSNENGDDTLVTFGDIALV
ncbi:MAG: biotin--[acetyl-CoA-carboxylase] ligase, partial [Pseudomonadota bacterium]